MDVFVLLITAALLGVRRRPGRMVLAAVMSALVVCLAVALPVGTLLFRLLGAQIPAGALLLFWGLRPRGRRAWLKGFLGMYGSAFLLGGLYTFLLQNGLTPEAFRPAVMPVLGGAGYLLLMGALRLWRRMKTGEKWYLNYNLSLDGFSVEGVCLVDSGNHLAEPMGGRPVSVMEKEAAVLMMEHVKKENFMLIPFHTVGRKNGMMRGFVGTELKLTGDGRVRLIKEPVIGISENRLSEKGTYQMILHPMLLKEEEYI